MPNSASDFLESRQQKQELENLQRVFVRLDKNNDKKVTPDELYDYLKRDLGYKCGKAMVEDMVWEVDEDCDGGVDWEEFKSMFHRVRHDKSGWEPRRMFNVVEFMMHDKDGSGTIDMDECMEVLFRRFGKQKLEEKVNEFMSHDMDRDKSISFGEFVAMDEKNDSSGTSSHPGFKLSAGIVATTKAENTRLLAKIESAIQKAGI
uniref:EF-hand domain-containing protein n=1 Tax=Haptolina brevifila TaxID=156173 RepID=A0A7S2DA72_9EUKA|mmetsp:Transcript_35089/g.70007  ORF Transcript_35089/g.70007 Transcript_35089/m.70007 type:complete len:204 (+) Transcript_35089:74-685(+)